MKKAFITISIIVFPLLFSVFASATNTNGEVDFGYSGVVGSYYVQSEDTTEETNSRIAITSNISYDATEKLFYITVSDIAKPFTSNVMDGIITNSTVRLTAPEGVAYELYCDGELYSGSISEITGVGDYVLRVQANSGVSEQVVAFRIIGASTGAVSSYTLPDGFYINSVTKDDSPVSCSSTSVSFEEEGAYKLNYRCASTGMTYSLNFTVDFTAPKLKLEALKDGKSWGPVDISDVEEGGSVQVFRNGKAEAYTPELTKSGQYDLVVKDAAGNETDYSFVIMVYFNSGSFFFFAAVLVLLAGLGVYIFISRKKLRIR